MNKNNFRLKLIDLIDNHLKDLSKFERANCLYVLRNEARKIEKSFYFMPSFIKGKLYKKLTKLYKKYCKKGLL